MTDCLEVLFVGDETGVIQCVDPRIGTTFINYRGGGTSKHGCTAIIDGDYLLSTDAGKPLLHVWPLNSQETLSGPKIVLSGRASALACSPDGAHCVVAIDAKLFVYETTSGALLAVISKHYRGVTKIAFLADSSHFVSCGENGGVLVWRLATAVDKHGVTVIDKTRSQEPVYSFSHHALRITDVYTGPYSMSGRLYTGSIDQTVKMYDLRNGTLLLSVCFDDSITAFCPNAIETTLYTGTSKGDIILFDLDPLPRTLDYNPTEADVSVKLRAHEKAVTSLACSFDGSLLVSGGEDAKVVVWDLIGKQQLRNISFKGSITTAFLCLASDTIFMENFSPKRVFKQFQRVSADDQGHEVNVIMRNTVDLLIHDVEDERDELIIQQGGSSEELDALKSALSQATRKNHELYQFTMRKILDNPCLV